MATPLSLEALVVVAHGLHQLGDWTMLLDLLGRGVTSYNTRRSTTDANEGLTENQMLAQLCYLRGVAQIKMEITDKGTASFVEALKLDPMCFEALTKLTDGHLLTPADELKLLESISATATSYDGVPSAFIKSLYSTRAAQTQSTSYIDSQLSTLMHTYKLPNNIDVVATQATVLYAKGNYQRASKLAQQVLAADEYHTGALLTQLACLYKQKMKNELFLVSHQLVDNMTGHQALPWYAVGVYYLVAQHSDKARQYFSRAISYDTTMVHAWMGFGHSFAQKDEHDSALSAFTTAARLAVRSHVPLLHMGKECLKLNDLVSAEQYLSLANDIAPRDALVLNELGVLYLRMGRYPQSQAAFARAIELDPSNPELESVFVNMGHVLRKQKNYQSARAMYERALQLNPLSASTITALGYIHHIEGSHHEAIELYHQALGLDSNYTIAADLLGRAMEDIFRHRASHVLSFAKPSRGAEKEAHGSSDSNSGPAGPRPVFDA